MTYEATETSIRSGSPIELYEFGSQYNRYLYTSYHSNIISGADTFVAEALSRNEILIEDEINKANITITIPFDTEIAQLFAIQPPPNPVTVAIYRYHGTDSISNKVLYWSGRILSTKWKVHTVELICESIYTSIQRQGLTRTYQRACPYVLYTYPCTAVAGNFVLIGPATTVSGNVITMASIVEATGYYNGGYLEYSKLGSLIEFRTIISQVGTTLTLSYNIPGLADGDEIKIYPGCNRTIDHCNNKFNVGEDYGGFPYVPSINPFSGGMLF